MDGWMNTGRKERMNEWIQWMDGWMNTGRKERRKNEMDGWRDGGREGGIN